MHVDRKPAARGISRGREIDRLPGPVGTCSTKSCAIVVENTKGAPWTGSTSGVFCRHKTSSGFTARRGGSWGASTAGKPITKTDLGFRNEGGLFNRRFK